MDPGAKPPGFPDKFEPELFHKCCSHRPVAGSHHLKRFFHTRRRPTGLCLHRGLLAAEVS